MVVLNAGSEAARCWLVDVDIGECLVHALANDGKKWCRLELFDDDCCGLLACYHWPLHEQELFDWKWWW